MSFDRDALINEFRGRLISILSRHQYQPLPHRLRKEYDSQRRELTQLLRSLSDTDPGVPADTWDEDETGPENSREEVTGISTSGTNRNMSSVGFSGGSPARVAPAIAVLDAVIRVASTGKPADASGRLHDDR